MGDLFLERDAVISECGQYRYLLRRTWDHDKPRALFVMLNPSTADADIDDPTIRSCIRLCKSLDYGSFEVVNLFAWRATDPKELSFVSEPIGEKTDPIMEAAVNRCDMIICGWGKNEFAKERARMVATSLRSFRPALFCFGKNKDGSPKHPLYIKSGTPLLAYAP
jgi:hypothetical protein